MTNEFDQYDAVGLAQLIRNKEIKPSELLEQAISRLEAYNPRIGAVIYKMYDEAQKSIESGLSDGPFRGVPFLLKDLKTQYQGVPMQNGSRAYKNYIPDYDSTLVTRYKKSGVCILGKTSTPELGLMGTTEPKAFPPTRNPWNLEYSSGGSSGGSAAAVAAGIVPIASAGDGGGSIRIPASFCGLFGLKPSRGRNPTGPKGGDNWQGAVVQHIISKSVRDSALMLDCTSGPEIGSRSFAPIPERSYYEETLRTPKQLKIGYNLASPVNLGIHPECERAINSTIELLQDLGHIVEEVHSPVDGMTIAKSYLTMYFGEVQAFLENSKVELGGKPRRKDFEASTRMLAALGRATSSGEFVRALQVWDRAARTMGVFHKEYDLYLTPTVAYMPAKIGTLGPTSGEELFLEVLERLGLSWILKKSGIAMKLALQNLKITPFTQLFNLTGQPAMSVPLYWSEEGFPIGSQFAAPIGRENTLFRLAAQLENARPWMERSPQMVSAYTN